ncbi:cytochrome c oxidase assembly protein [Opitutus sp. ER46]|uniref:cytochrome c oxidase assembly protein n=1 Tax=Opitutus sp. ER46 TaxID=2161864 RepID=UPI000D306084|nr:cytochrome c oxidase assembly protein [Opitutus sp. ER46]PTX91035.1 hypothetical protein DB354_20555 [Opitutus sp. ER46]
MSLFTYFFQGWNWNPAVLVTLLLAGAVYVWRFGRRGRPVCFVAALLVVAVALLSPLNLLANGVLFSAHMAQHILLLLFVPGLVLLSLPASAPARLRPEPAAAGALRPTSPLAVLGWVLGVGSMWFWHLPQVCNLAATRPPIHALQSLSLITMGALFWWPILAPRSSQRLNPGFGVGYLFTACLGCSALGILITLSPLEVCAAFTAPTTAPSLWADLRERLTFRRDQQLGGLLMWVPMCLVYVAAIVLELTRWLGSGRTAPHLPAPKGSA